MTAATATHLVLEREGWLWAVPGAAVEHLERGGGRVTVRLKASVEAAVEAGGAPAVEPAVEIGARSASSGELAADRLLAVAAGLAVHRAPGALGRYWDEAAAGVALWARRPVVVIDPAHPPRVLTARSAEDDRDG